MATLAALLFDAGGIVTRFARLHIESDERLKAVVAVVMSNSRAITNKDVSYKRGLLGQNGYGCCVVVVVACVAVAVVCNCYS